jgi:polysaccharide biosynthesis transport protein
MVEEKNDSPETNGNKVNFEGSGNSEGFDTQSFATPRGGNKGDSDYQLGDDKLYAPLVKEVDTEEFRTRYDTQKLFLGVSRHIPTIIASILIWFGICSLLTYHYLTNYVAESVVLYQADQPVPLPGGSSLPQLSLPTVLDLIKLPGNFESVRKILGLDLSAKQIEDMTDVPVPRNNSNLIKIETRGDNPSLVIDIANTLAKVAVKNSQEFTQKLLQASLDNYKHQLEIVNQRLNSQLNEIEVFKAQNKYFEMTADHLVFIKLVSDIRAKDQQANLDYNSMLVEYENLKSEVSSLPDQIPVSQNVFREGQLNPLQARIVTLQTTLGEAKAKYSPQNPKLIAMEAELQSLMSQANSSTSDKTKEQSQFFERNLLKDQMVVNLMTMESKVRALFKTREQLNQYVVQLEKEEQTLPSKQIAFSKLLDQKKLTEGEIKFLNDAIENTQLMINVPKGSIALYQLADRSKPLRDSLFIILLPLLGLLFGIAFGILIAVFMEMRDDKLRTTRQLELYYNAPCIGIIPEIPSLSKNNSENTTLFYIRNLAERLERMFPQQAYGKKPAGISLALTSSTVGEGKSTLAYNLALYFQRLGEKVLLLEGDYHPSIFSEGTAKLTFESYLKDGGDISDLIIKGSIDRIKTGKHEPWMKELIKSDRMEALWKDLNSKYDMIVIDTPGVIEDHYAINLISMADIGIYIINSSGVSKNIVDQGLTQLDLYDARPSGLVLNRVAPGYIDDERILLETKRMRKGFLKSLLFWIKS